MCAGLQTERERANAVDMHTTFQQELVKLRLNTAKAYYKVLTDGQVLSLVFLLHVSQLPWITARYQSCMLIKAFLK